VIEDRDLQSLVAFAGPGKVLSVYLDTDLADKSKDAVKLMFRTKTKDIQEEAAREIAAVAKFLDFDFAWQSRGLAVFASDDNLWKVLPLPVPVGSRVIYNDKPYVRTLTDVLDRFGQYGVAVVDRETVRLFSVAWGRIRAETEAFGEELKRHKQGGWAAARYQRREDNLALHNLRQAVEVTQAFCDTHHCERLVLAGSSEALSQIWDLLPNPLRGHVLGEFVVDIEASPNEILSRSLEIAEQVDASREKELVTEAITAAAKGAAGVSGLADTLHLLHQGRVHVLLVDERYESPGFVCSHCGYVAAGPADGQPPAACPFCAHEGMEATGDVINLAIRKAIETGAGVNIVRNNQELIQAGGIAALLRY